MHNITKLYYKTSLELGLPTLERDDDIDGFTVVFGKYRYHFRGGFTPFNNVSSVSIGSNKYSTNKVLEAEGIPVPKAGGVTSEQFHKNNWNIDQLQYPVVAKPTIGSACGHDVVCNLKDKVALVDYIKRNIKDHQTISIEEYQGGLRSFRVLVFYGEVIGVVERIPAHVVGDGVHTIRELIDEKNIIRKEMKDTLPTGPIKVNQETDLIFDEMGITIEDVPEQGKIIPIRYICNSTYGGTFVSYEPNIVCVQNKKMAIKAARALSLNLVGFDVLCEDIRIPIETSRGYFIEANSDPDITIHEQDYWGTKVEVSKTIMKKLIAKHPFLYFKNKYPLFTMISQIVLAVGALIAIFWAVQAHG